MRNHFIKKLTEIAKEDSRVLLITGDLGFGVFDDFQKELPDQFINAGVAEQNMTGLATGLAMEGFKVFTYSIGNFSTLRCLEQIRNDSCYHEANVNVVSIGGGFSYGQLGPSHHATEDLSIMRSLPNITVVSPSDLWETMEATKQLIELKGTTYLRLDKSVAETTPKEGEKFELGKFRKIMDGNDFTLLATGGILSHAIEAAKELQKDGIYCRVYSVHTIKPLDQETLMEASKETKGIVTVEEHTVDGGLGSAVAEVLLESGAAPKSFYRIGLRAGFSSLVGDQEYLRDFYNINKGSIIKKVKELLLGS